MPVSKWGNSLTVRLPKAVVEALGLKAGDEIDLTALPGGAVGVRKVDPGAEFLARMAEFNVRAPKDIDSIATRRTSGRAPFWDTNVFVYAFIAGSKQQIARRALASGGSPASRCSTSSPM
jgi:antitoxin MazE